MTSYVTPKKGVEYIFYIGLVSRSTGQYQANPTLAAGDFKVSIDGAAFGNLATLPAATPASGRSVKVTLSTSEMNGDNIVVQGVDAAGAEWDDVIINIQTTARQIDDLAFPTVSGRGLDVSAGGEAGVDWANIGSPTTTVNLSGTTVKTATDVETDTADIQSRLPAALSGDGFMKADLLSIGDELVSGNNATLKLKQLHIRNDSGTALFAVSDASGYGALFDAVGEGFAGIEINGSGAGNPGLEIFGVDGVGVSIVGGNGKSINAPQDIALPSGDLDDQLQALPTASEVTDAVWDEATSGHTTAGTTGKALTDAGSAGDPWGTALPGAYSAGTAGKIIGDNINATISSRSSHSAADVWAVGTRTLTSFGTLVADIWANTTRTLTAISDSAGVTTLLSRIGSALNITSGKVESNVKQINDADVTGDGSSGNPWGPA